MLSLHVFYLLAAAHSMHADESLDLSNLYGDEDRPMENESLIEGDIVGNGDTLKALPSDENRWPKGIIPYVIDSSLSDKESIIQDAMRHIEGQTKCIHFVPRRSENDFVRISKKSGCYSNIGKQGGEQTISIGKGCDYFGTIVHELTHAIGFHHEHTRADRDSFIKVYLNNINPKFHSQFRLKSEMEDRLIDGFNYDSVMLYGSRAFSTSPRQPSMTKLNGDALVEVHHKKGLSRNDIDRIRKLYKC